MTALSYTQMEAMARSGKEHFIARLLREKQLPEEILYTALQSSQSFKVIRSILLRSDCPLAVLQELSEGHMGEALAQAAQQHPKLNENLYKS